MVELNDAFLTRSNVSRDKIVGQKGLCLSYWKEPKQFYTYVETVKLNGFFSNFEVQYCNHSGEVRTVLLSGTLIDWEGERCILTISNDNTELRQYEKELFRLDKLNLMGQMAGSIAHEIRNPMTSIKGFLQLFQQQDKYNQGRESIELMIEEIDRVNDIITNFLSLSKLNHVEVTSMNLNDCMINVLQLIIADATKNDVYVDFKFEHTSEIMIDKGEIRQLILNLTRNAIESMPEGGHLTMKIFEDSNGVNLTVQDEGAGIPPEILEKMGTPFLTTNKEGTGLGVAICFSIAERYNAKITIDTSPKGTIFKVIFPLAG